MITLQEYIHSLCFRGQILATEQYNNYIEFIGEDQDIDLDIHSDYIWEMLRSHNTSLLIKKIKERFRCDDIYVDPQTDSRSDKEIIKIINPNFSEDDKDFINLISFFNYHINGSLNNELYLEPRFTERVSIPASSCGCVYHLTPNINLSSILRRGLRIRSENDSRKYPERIYLFTCTPQKVKELALDILKRLDPRGSINNYTILKINLNSHNIDLYKDTGMEDLMDYSMFTYENIPCNCIKVINW